MSQINNNPPSYVPVPTNPADGVTDVSGNEALSNVDSTPSTTTHNDNFILETPGSRSNVLASAPPIPGDGVSKVDGKVMASANSKLGFLGEGPVAHQALKLRAEGDIGAYATPSLGVGGDAGGQNLGWISPNAPAVVPAAPDPTPTTPSSASPASSASQTSTSSPSTSSASSKSNSGSSSSTDSAYDDPKMADKINKQASEWVKESQFKTPKRNCANPTGSIISRTGLSAETADKAVKLMHYQTTRGDAQTIAMALATLANQKPPNKQDQANFTKAIDRMFVDQDVMNGDGSGAQKAGKDYEKSLGVVDTLGTKLTGGSDSTSTAGQFDTDSAVAVNSWK
jgi:hypothetical protein